MSILKFYLVKFPKDNAEPVYQIFNFTIFLWYIILMKMANLESCFNLVYFSLSSMLRIVSTVRHVISRKNLLCHLYQFLKSSQLAMLYESRSEDSIQILIHVCCKYKYLRLIFALTNIIVDRHKDLIRRNFADYLLMPGRAYVSS